MFAKWHTVNGIKCQGNVEKSVAELILSMDRPIMRGKAVKTPHGNYTPDFDCGDYFLEVKTFHSWLVALGVISFLENGRIEAFKKITNNSQLKMEWVNNNVKHVYVYIETTQVSNKFRNINEPYTLLETIRGNTENLKKFINLL